MLILKSPLSKMAIFWRSNNTYRLSTSLNKRNSTSRRKFAHFKWQSDKKSCYYIHSLMHLAYYKTRLQAAFKKKFNNEVNCFQKSYTFEKLLKKYSVLKSGSIKKEKKKEKKNGEKWRKKDEIRNSIWNKADCQFSKGWKYFFLFLILTSVDEF